MSTHGLHQRELGVGERRCPTATMALCIGLERPVAVKEEWTLKFGLVETHHLRPIPGEDLIELLLLFFGVDASHVIAHHGELVKML